MDLDVLWAQFYAYKPMFDEMHAAWLKMPPGNVDVPYVSGDAVVGGVLNCTMGNWNRADTAEYAYAWMSDETTELGTDPTYTVAESDAGHSLTCVVTATNEHGATEAPPSNAIVIEAAAEDEDLPTRAAPPPQRESREERPQHRR